VVWQYHQEHALRNIWNAPASEARRYFRVTGRD
jgi:hypothetical protein